MRQAVFNNSPKYDIKRTANGKIVASNSYAPTLPTGTHNWGFPAPMVRWPQIIANLFTSTDVGTNSATVSASVTLGITLFNGTLTWRSNTSSSSSTYGTGLFSFSLSATLDKLGWLENQTSFSNLFPTKASWIGNGTSFSVTTNPIFSGAVQSKFEVASITRRKRMLFQGV
ncbi:hypothetical protein KAR91_23505 [Candidatus Pacearchaeota archaeon]|nr:hypothetical protein [Candidatus Pacearchaeota archaeon]